MRRRSDRASKWLFRLIEQLNAADPLAAPEAVLRALLEAFGLSGGWIFWLEDEEEASFSVAAAVGLPPELEAEDRAPLRGSPCRCQRMAVSGELPEAGGWISCERLEGLGIPAEHLTIPLRIGGRLHGLVNLLAPAGFQMEADMRQALTAAGQICGPILGYLHALHRLQRQYDRLQMLSRIARRANELLSLEDLLGEITRAIVEMLQGDRGAIALMAEGGDHLRVVAEYNPIGTPSGLGATIPIGGNPSMAWILQERRPLAILDVDTDPLLGPVRPVLQAIGIRSLLIVPLVSEGRVIGTLGIDSVRGHRVFTPEEIQLAEAVAAQVAGAVERARLLAEARRQAAYRSALHEILREAVGAQDLEGLMELVLGRLRATLGTPMGGIWLERHAVLHGLPADFRSGMAEVARRAGIALREVHAVGDWAALPADHPLQPMRPLMERFGIRASLTVPIRHGGQEIGGLSVASPEPRVWREEEIELMEAVGQELGAVAERIQLVQSLRDHVAHLQGLYRTAQALVQAEDLPMLLETALREIRAHLPADAASIYRWDPERPRQLRLVAHQGFSPENVRYFQTHDLEAPEPGASITVQAFRQGKPVWVERVEDFPYPPEARAVVLRDGIRSLAAVPLRIGGEPLGVLNVAWRTHRPFHPGVQSLLQGLADLLAAGIHRSRLLERTQRQAQELAALNRALSEALRIREEMIQNVSHELRTPLAVAMGYLELLAEGAFGPLSPEQQEAITVSRGRLEELRRYIELVLTLQAARQGELARIPLDLRRLVEEVLRRWMARLDRTRHEVQARLPAEAIWLTGDPEGLARAIGEVLDNAVKFSPQGGRIEIALREEEGRAVLEVQDEGIGVPEERLGQIGEPFYQVDGGATRRFGGMGIGLAVARSVVEAHGGQLIVRPRSPRGTEVRIVLPFAAVEHPVGMAEERDPE